MDEEKKKFPSRHSKNTWPSGDGTLILQKPSPEE